MDVDLSGLYWTRLGKAAGLDVDLSGQRSGDHLYWTRLGTAAGLDVDLSGQRSGDHLYWTRLGTAAGLDVDLSGQRSGDHLYWTTQCKISQYLHIANGTKWPPLCRRYCRCISFPQISPEITA